MELFDLLGIASGACEALGLRYYIGGAVASGYWGDPRPTRDVDIVVILPPSKVRDLCALFQAPDYYVSVDAALDAVRRGTQFNIIHPASGFTVDVMTPFNEGYRSVQFDRARRIQLEGGPGTVFAAPEDVILNKMIYYREGHSDKHLRDIAAILKVGDKEIDRGYIASWAVNLDVMDVWNRILSGIGPQQSLPFRESPPP